MTVFAVFPGLFAAVFLRDYSHIVVDCANIPERLQVDPYSVILGENKPLQHSVLNYHDVSGSGLVESWLSFAIVFILTHNGFECLIKMNTVILLKTY